MNKMRVCSSWNIYASTANCHRKIRTEKDHAFIQIHQNIDIQLIHGHEIESRGLMIIKKSGN